MIDRHYPSLGKRAQQVLRLLADSKNRQQIADILDIDIETVRSHIKDLHLNFAPKAFNDDIKKARTEEAIANARELGYLPMPRYSLKEKIEQLSNENVEILRALESFQGYGPDKPIFYKRFVGESPAELQRFKHEVDVLSRIQHDNILDLHDFGWDEQRRPFFTMPYYAPFDGILAACEDSPEKIDNFLLQLLNVLGYLHWRGIIFNNLHRKNIFVASKKKVLLMDFGNSVIVDRTASLSRMNEDRKDVIGSQVSVDAISIQSDFQALGSLIFRILTSDHNLSCEPFTPEIGEQMVRELRQRPADRGMAGIVESLLSAKPENCFQSAFEVTESLLRTKRDTFNQNRAFTKWVKGFSRMEPIGRDVVLTQLKSALSKLFEARKGGFHLVVGEAGVGKSALLKQLRREARGLAEPESLLSYVKVEKKSSVNRGYRMWRDILRRLIEAAERDGLTGETARAIKGLQKLLDPSDTTATVTGSEGSIEQAALHLFRNLKARKGAKNKVVVLLLDDLQLMGEDSYSLFKKLHNDILRLNLPVLIIASYKEFDPNEGRMLNDLVNDLDLSTELLKLETLNQEASRQLSRYLLSTLNLQNSLYQVELDQLTQIVADKSRGIPLRVIRYVQVAAQHDRLDAIKAELDEIWSAEDESDREVVAWLQHNKYLNDKSQLFLAKVALIGIRVDTAVLSVLYPDEGTLKSLLYACYDAGVLIENNQQVKFLHGSVRDAAQKFLPEKAQEIYKDVASAIENSYSSNLSDYCSQLADLWLKANDRKRAASYYLKAARSELNKSAYRATKEHAEKILKSGLDAELQRLEKAEATLIQYFAHMGLGEVHLAFESARNALDVLGYRIIKDPSFRLPLIKASLKQIWYRLREGKLKQKTSINMDESREEFRIAVRCYRALTQLEYFRNNFWHVLYYLMEGLNLCDEIGDVGRGQKADIYAAAMVVTSPLGTGILSKLIASQYKELAQNDLEKSGDKALEIWMRLVLGMYYCSIGKWNDAKRHLERGVELGMAGIDQRRRYEIVAISYLCLWYCGEWEQARNRNDYLRELVRDHKLIPGSLSQTDLWPQLFDGDKYLYTGEFKQGQAVLEDICRDSLELDKAAWLRSIGVLAQAYLRSGERNKAEAAANDFLTNIRGKPVMPFYATEGFFGALEVYLELLESVDDVKSKALRQKIARLLYYLLDQPILAYSKRYPIAKPRALLYKARYVLITTSKKDKSKRLADLALKYAQDLKMRYDEALILEFIGTHLSEDNSGRGPLERAHEIFKKLGATWNCSRVGEYLVS